MQRQHGIYVVNLEGLKVYALWRGQFWSLFGSPYTYKDEEFRAIGELVVSINPQGSYAKSQPRPGS